MKHIQSWLFFICLSLLIMTQGCIAEEFSNAKEGENNVYISFKPQNSIVAGETQITGLRIIAFNSAGALEINKPETELQKTSKGNYEMMLRPGCYTLYALANVPSEIENPLKQITSMQELDALKMSYASELSETDIALCWKKMIFVKSVGEGITHGKVSFDNLLWKDSLNMQMEHAAAKISIACRKENPGEAIEIESISIHNNPAYTTVEQTFYPASEQLRNNELLSLTTPISITSETGVYTPVLSGTLIPENKAASVSRESMLLIHYTKGGKKALAEIPMGDIERNHFYQYEVLFTAVSVEIENITVLPWNPNETDGIIPEVSISFSQLNVPYSYTNPSKIYFTTRNVPENALTLLNEFANSDKQVALKFDMTQTKLDYSYDKETQTGTGTLTIKRNKKSIGNDLLVIQAANLKRSIRVGGSGMAGSNIYWDAALQRLAFDDVPFEGQTAPHEKYQGVPFFWGGLQAMPGGSESESISRVMDYIWCSTGDIKINSPKLATYYTTVVNQKFPFKPDEGRGDICLFMTRRGWAPKNNKWRLPNKKEFLEFTSISQDGTYLTPRPAPGHQSGYNRDGTGITTSGLRLDNYYLPNSGYFHNTYGVSGNGLGFNAFVNSNSYYMIEDRAPGGTEISLMYVVSKGRIGVQGLNTNDYFGLFVRCIVDDSHGEIIPLYMLSYDLQNNGSGIITAPTKSGMILNQYADQGGSIVLSDIKLPDTNGLVHQGWLIDEKDYALGATVSNITKDIVAVPKWGK